MSEESRVRQRYVDLVVRPQAREMVRTRAAVVRSLRRSLHDLDYLEVETPMLQCCMAVRRPVHSSPIAMRSTRICISDRSGAIPEALCGRWHRAGLRDQPKLPQ